MINEESLTEKVIQWLSKYKIICAIVVPLLLFLYLWCTTRDYENSKANILDILSVIGFILTIFVLENVEKSKLIVNGLVTELWDQEITGIENELRRIGESICNERHSFAIITKNETTFLSNTIIFRTSLKKYIDKYSSLETTDEVQKYNRFNKDADISTILKNERVFDSFISIMEPLYIMIDSEISKNIKTRLKETGTKK